MNRKHKPFNLYQKKSTGIYYVRIYNPDTHSYSPAKSTGEIDLELARDKAREMKKAGQIKKLESDPLFVNHLKEYWQRREKELSTAYYREIISSIDNRVKSFKDFERLRLSQLETFHIYRFIDYLKDDLKITVRPINRIIQSIKTYLVWAYKRNYILTNIASQIIREKEPKSERGFLTAEEIIKLVNLNWPDIRLQAFVNLCVCGGLRRGEARGLTWGQIDFENNIITIDRNFVGDYDKDGNAIFKKPKAGSAGKIPALVIPELKNILLKLLEDSPFRQPNDLVLFNLWGTSKPKPIAEITLRREFIKMLEGIGISREQAKARKIVMHGLRHSYATLLSGILPEHIVKQLTRHETTQMLGRYSHREDTALIEGIKTVNSYLDKYRKDITIQ